MINSLMTRKGTVRQPGMKGQAAIEFYAFLGIFLFVFTFIGFTFLTQAAAQGNRIRGEIGYEISGAYADMVNFAAIAGNGFFGYFTPPSKKILDSYYDITYYGDSRIVFINGTSTQGKFGYSHSLITGNITVAGTFNSEHVKCILVRNNNGTIVITTYTNPC